MQVLLLPQYKQLGFSYGPRGQRKQRSWLQFADDSVIVTRDQASAQSLLNLFQAWCAWSGMTIRRDKCVTYGMGPVGSSYLQSSPFLTLSQGSFLLSPLQESSGTWGDLSPLTPNS